MDTLLSIRHQIARHLRGMGRFALFHLVKSDYRPYARPHDVQWQGCYEWNNRCLGFRDNDDKMFYSW